MDSPESGRVELARILEGYAGESGPLSPDQAAAVSALVACRTQRLGGHLLRCERCGREHPAYNSCRNRHCPKCQNLDQACWVEREAAGLLPVVYFHVVFTVPQLLAGLFRLDPRRLYPLLFHAAAETLLDVCRRRLGATPGILAVLHTWTQTLRFHPHIHCIVTGGGLSLDQLRVPEILTTPLPEILATPA